MLQFEHLICVLFFFLHLFFAASLLFPRRRALFVRLHVLLLLGGE